MEIRGLLILILAVMVSGAAAATFMFKNNCQYTVWPGSLAGSSSTQLSSTGFELAMGASQSIDSPASWSGKFWARTGCSNASGKFTCATADCGSGQIECNGAGESTPATLAEFTVAASGGQDTYDVSLVDGFNLPLSITPQGSSGCNPTSCPADINSMCPMELAFKGPNGSVVGCKSACVAFNQPQYCCTGAFGTPATCPPTNFSMIFKKACPQAYSYAYDDKSSTFTCTGGTNYLITLCP